jgi:hypothetical protein
MRGIAPRLFRMAQVLAGSALVLQAGGCTFVEFNELLQTVLLGVTAAGAIAIIQNI